jgi:hypothetical protein
VSPATASVQLFLYAPGPFLVLFADPLEALLPSLFVLVVFFPAPLTCLLALLVDAFSFFPPAFFVLPVALLTVLAPALLLFLPKSLALFFLLLLATLALLLLSPLLSFDLALFFELLRSDSFTLMAPSLCLVCPLFVRLASSRFLFRCSLCADLKGSIFSHLRQALLLDELVE